MTKELIGVIGAGVIGIGVAQDFAQSGYPVVLLDVTDEKLQSARANIRNNLRQQGLLGQNRQREGSAVVLQRIHLSTDYASLKEADFVIENITENWALKQAAYAEIDKICPPHTIFAANTSAIPITRIAAATGRPQQVIGIHFMNPVPLKSTVEVIRGHHTSTPTLEAVTRLLKSLGKEAIIVNDSPGFVSNRVLMLTINEAIFLVHEGVASAADIDRIFKTCFGHKMGPLETADLIGLDTILYSIEVLYESFADAKYRPCPLLKRMVDAGLKGRKSGHGFYPYTG